MTTVRVDRQALEIILNVYDGAEDRHSVVGDSAATMLRLSLKWQHDRPPSFESTGAEMETEWTGRYQTIEVTEWWCPTETGWVDCPVHNLCAHLTKRTRKVNTKVMRPVLGSDGQSGGDDAQPG